MYQLKREALDFAIYTWLWVCCGYSISWNTPGTTLLWAFLFNQTGRVSHSRQVFLAHLRHLILAYFLLGFSPLQLGSILHLNLVFRMLELMRLRDESIMVGLSHVTDSKAALHRLNQYRIFLKVVSATDISTAAGTEISSALFDESSNLPYRSCCRNSYAWPSQDSPPHKDWTFWKESVKEPFVQTTGC